MRERNAFEKALLGNKRVLQGGVYNYLGKEKTVNAPLKWKSSPKHPVAYLTYITKEEADILIKKNIYGSLKDGKPNKGPFGIASLQGSGSGSEGAGTADSSSQAGDPGYSDYSDASMGTPGPGAGAGSPGFSPDIGGIVGPGPGQQDVTGFGTDYSDADMGPVGPNAMGQVDALAQTLEDQAYREKNPAMARLQPLGIAAYNMSLNNPTRTTAEKAMGFVASPFSTVAATVYDSYARGVARPGTEQFDQDYGKMDFTTDVVNVGPPSFSPEGSGDGITSIKNTFKPLDNSNAYIPYTQKPFYVQDPLTGVIKSLI